MKTPSARILIASAGLSLFSLSSCVDPYYAGNPGPQRTTYSAGYEVRSLPSGYRTEVVQGTQYYYHNGTYYRPRSGRYVVVEAPRSRDGRYDDRRRDSRYDRREGYGRGPGQRDTVIYQLPRGYRTVEHRGRRYYRVNDTYYEQRGSTYVQVRLSL